MDAGPLLNSLITALAEVRLASKRAAGRPRDKAVLEVLEKTLREKEQSS